MRDITLQQKKAVQTLSGKLLLHISNFQVRLINFRPIPRGKKEKFPPEIGQEPPCYRINVKKYPFQKMLGLFHCKCNNPVQRSLVICGIQCFHLRMQLRNANPFVYEFLFHRNCPLKT